MWHFFGFVAVWLCCCLALLLFAVSCFGFVVFCRQRKFTLFDRLGFRRTLRFCARPSNFAMVKGFMTVPWRPRTQLSRSLVLVASLGLLRFCYSTSSLTVAVSMQVQAMDTADVKKCDKEWRIGKFACEFSGSPRQVRPRLFCDSIANSKLDRPCLSPNSLPLHRLSPGGPSQAARYRRPGTRAQAAQRMRPGACGSAQAAFYDSTRLGVCPLASSENCKRL